jgi:precorrin-8X/cobalt-precorrin-8 methylmutase
MPGPLFDSYLIVDWSASSQPCLGEDSIWFCVVRREEGRLRRVALENIATRLNARQRLLEILAAELSSGRSIFAGFDFAFGYPSGFAARLGLSGSPWRATWDLLSEEIQENGKNKNNRFEIAANLNRRIGSGTFYFWGCPVGNSREFLSATKQCLYLPPDLSEKRITEKSTRGTKAVWQLHYNGSVGSQTLMGIPVLRFLRDHPAIAHATRVWPFETGLRQPTRQSGGQVVLAEIYPSSVPISVADGQVKDEAQVCALAQNFAEWDNDDTFASLFAGDPALSPEQRRLIENEEGWILARRSAATAAAIHPPMMPTRYDYLRDADAIYRESFARIRAEADLSALPEALHTLALRLAHAGGDAGMLRDLVWSEGAVVAGSAALAAGAPILTDAAMVKAGIIARRLPRKNKVLCLLDDKRVPALAKRLGTTRSAAAVELWRPHLAGAIVAIGNAPTALFHLLEMIAAGAPKPALVLGFPVGFVGAAEAKAALAANTLGLAFVALAGRRGGSALAAAAVNALAGEEM